jgi:hypothetical protein
MVGDLTRNRGPHLIRLIGPIFPLTNIFFVWAGFKGAIFLVNCSYVATLVFVICWYLNYDHKKNVNYLYIHKERRIFTKSFFYHYLAFFVAVSLVLMNLNLDYKKFEIYELRLPIYIYSISSFLLPYYGHKLKAINFVNFYIIVPLASFIFYLYKYIYGSLMIIILLEASLILILTYISYCKTTNNLNVFDSSI